MRRITAASALLSSLTAALFAYPVPPSAAQGPPGRSTEGVGVEVFTTKARPQALSDLQKEAVVKARQYVEEHGERLSHPYVDRDTGLLIIPVVDPRHLEVARGAVKSGRVPDVRTAHPVQSRSFAHLERIKHDIVDLKEADLPGANAIVASYVDEENNRVVIQAFAATQDMLRGIVSRYGPSSVAVHLKEELSVSREPAARNDDKAPFYGGANIGCTTGFPYRRGSYTYMVTAGHCYSSGGTATTSGGLRLGTVTSGSRENWTAGVGTVRLTGDTRYLGDLALINTSSWLTGGTPNGSAPYIYRGPAGSAAYSRIGGVDFTYRGDQYCTGGAVTGEQCAWYVDEIFTDYKYTTAGLVRNVAIGTKRRYCIRGGDSGGPVYNVQADGSVRAKGIISGVTGLGGSDHYIGVFETGECVNVFTDIWRSVDAWGGSVMTR